MTLTEQFYPGLPSGDGLRRAKRLVQIVVVVSAIMVIAGGVIAASARPNFIRVILESSSVLRPGSLFPAKVGSKSSQNRQAIGTAEARRLNDAIPFAEVGLPARPFIQTGSVTDRDRAVDCLALAAMAEAGGDDRGQRAVIQVILNRVRHPAFAKTICGVVFEGAHRSTGCQFTFTCDGALARRHSPEAWSNARDRAVEALEGRVYDPVGLATHYHTDWVHPYWSASLIKLARVDTHLFFRWPGSSGGPASLTTPYRGGEPAITQLAYLSAHSEYAQAIPLHETDAGISRDNGLIDVVVRNGDGGAFVALAGAPSAEQARGIGRDVCAGRASCKVFGWFDRASIPAGYPVPTSARAKLGFSYFRSSPNSETVLYDCSRFSGIAIDGCLPRSARTRPIMRAASSVEVIAENAQTGQIQTEFTTSAGS